MHPRRKSPRHVRAANARWRRPAPDELQAIRCDWRDDVRQSFELDLRSYGGQWLRFEPRLGYHASRMYDASTGQLLRCAAMKTLLHEVANQLPRMLSPRRRE